VHARRVQGMLRFMQNRDVERGRRTASDDG
jgi:hypothetical protein